MEVCSKRGNRDLKNNNHAQLVRLLAAFRNIITRSMLLVISWSPAMESVPSLNVITVLHGHWSFGTPVLPAIHTPPARCAHFLSPSTRCCVIVGPESEALELLSDFTLTKSSVSKDRWRERERARERQNVVEQRARENGVFVHRDEILAHPKRRLHFPCQCGRKCLPTTKTTTPIILLRQRPPPQKNLPSSFRGHPQQERQQHTVTTYTRKKSMMMPITCRIRCDRLSHKPKKRCNRHNKNFSTILPRILKIILPIQQRVSWTSKIPPNTSCSCCFKTIRTCCCGRPRLQPCHVLPPPWKDSMERLQQQRRRCWVPILNIPFQSKHHHLLRVQRLLRLRPNNPWTTCPCHESKAEY